MEPTMFEVVLAWVYAIPCIVIMVMGFLTAPKKKEENITILRIGK